LERRLAAILAADVDGYTALMGADEAGTLRRLTDLRQEFLEPLIGEHHGRVVKLMGDGLLVEFASVVDAVSCALAWQDGVAEREAATEEDNRLQFRIGINLGDVIVEGNDIHGDGVNIVARLEGLAEPGGICLSGDAYRQARGKVEAEFEDLGEQVLKNVAEPVRVFRIAGDRSAVAAPSPTTDTLPLPDKPSIAVLPFTNMSGDPEQEYFSDGITEDIITELARFPSLFVIARNSTFAFKGKAANIQKIGRELGVRYVIEGSVRKAGNRVRITAQLIEADTGSHLWAQRYDRELEEIFSVQEEVSRTIASTLVSKVEQDRLESVGSRHPDDLEAYDYVLRGKTHVAKYTREDIQKGARCFERAIKISPDYVDAIAWLAQCRAWEFEGWWAEDPPGSLEQAFQLARKAVGIDAANAQAHSSLAYAYLYKRQHKQAVYHFERALDLMPCDAFTMSNYGMCFMFAGEPNPGLDWIRRAEDLNPLQSQWYGWLRAMAHYTARNYQAALDDFVQILYPPVEVHGWVAACYAQLGEAKPAEQALERFMAQAKMEFPRYPGDREDGWRDYWWWMEPYQRDEDFEHVLEGLRRAGLQL
jgi:TolB-like protein